MKSKRLGKGRWVLGDCLEAMSKIPDNCIDLILCDLPYGFTRNKWDSIIPFEPLWEQYNRICKDTSPVLLMGVQAFSALTVVSNLKFFKYQIVWEKFRPTGFLNARRQPLRKHEDINVFYRKQCVYNPQMSQGEPYDRGIIKSISSNYGKAKPKRRINIDGKRFPNDIIKIYENINRITIHPTQKPVTLFEYLIKTYSNEGDLILDNCAGSGTTAIACENLNRRWLCIEKDKEYSNKALNRIRQHIKEVKEKV